MYISIDFKDLEAVSNLISTQPQILEDTLSDGTTMYHQVAEFGMVKSLDRMAICNSRYFDTPDLEGNTPLYMAMLSGNAEMAEFLIGIGANCDILRKFFPIGFLGTNDCRSILKAIHPNQQFPSPGWYEHPPDLQVPLSEQRIREIRYRIYFQPSLVWRLVRSLIPPFQFDSYYL